MKTNKSFSLFVAAILLIAIHVVVCHLDCVKLTTRYVVTVIGGPPQEAVITYQDMSASFVLGMAAIQILLLALPKMGFRVVSTILTAVVSFIAASGLAELDVFGTIGGLTTSTRELTGLGYTAVVLSGVIVVVQIVAIILWRWESRVADRAVSPEIIEMGHHE